MKIKQFRYSSDNNLAYLVYGDKTGMAIDGGAAEEILSFIETNNLTLKYVTNTHRHMDHTPGDKTLLDRSGAVFLGNEILIKNRATSSRKKASLTASSATAVLNCCSPASWKIATTWFPTPRII